MAKELIFKLGGKDFSAAPVKLERKKSMTGPTQKSMQGNFLETEIASNIRKRWEEVVP